MVKYPTMNNEVIDKAFRILSREVARLREPIVGRVARDHDPFKVLVSTMLSLRTKDSTTEQACERLFSLASTPEGILGLPVGTIEKAIFPVGFYKTKAKSIREASALILERYGGKVPPDLDELLTLPGVGRKTANLVVILGYDGMGICVDTHVHRISNRWGYVRTKTPEETEFALRAKLPAEHWQRFNTLLVAFGRNICRPISPLCSQCPVEAHCDRVGVTKSR